MSNDRQAERSEISLTEIKFVIENDRRVNGEKFLSIDRRANVRLGANERKQRSKGLETSLQDGTRLGIRRVEAFECTRQLWRRIGYRTPVIVEDNFAETFD